MDFYLQLAGKSVPLLPLAPVTAAFDAFFTSLSSGLESGAAIRSMDWRSWLHCRNSCLSKE
jgi:hypothetical protein